jgi:hypothetical protein
MKSREYSIMQALLFNVEIPAINVIWLNVEVLQSNIQQPSLPRKEERGARPSPIRTSAELPPQHVNFS